MEPKGGVVEKLRHPIQDILFSLGCRRHHDGLMHRNAYEDNEEAINFPVGTYVIGDDLAMRQIMVDVDPIVQNPTIIKPTLRQFVGKESPCPARAVYLVAIHWSCNSLSDNSGRTKIQQGNAVYIGEGLFLSASSNFHEPFFNLAGTWTMKAFAIDRSLPLPVDINLLAEGYMHGALELEFVSRFKDTSIPALKQITSNLDLNIKNDMCLLRACERKLFPPNKTAALPPKCSTSPDLLLKYLKERASASSIVPESLTDKISNSPYISEDSTERGSISSKLSEGLIEKALNSLTLLEDLTEKASVVSDSSEALTENTSISSDLPDEPAEAKALASPNQPKSQNESPIAIDVDVVVHNARPCPNPITEQRYKDHNGNGMNVDELKQRVATLHPLKKTNSTGQVVEGICENPHQPIPQAGGPLLIYDMSTLPGTSGGAVFRRGTRELLGLHINSSGTKQSMTSEDRNIAISLSHHDCRRWFVRDIWPTMQRSSDQELRQAWEESLAPNLSAEWWGATSG